VLCYTALEVNLKNTGSLIDLLEGYEAVHNVYHNWEQDEGNTFQIPYQKQNEPPLSGD